MIIRVGSLFSGIGGLDLGLERAGMTVVWQSEIDPYASKVLAKHWPHVPNLGDITAIDWSTVEPVDLICGGYPCPPFSSSGLRRGHDDARNLWPRMLDAVRVVRPRWVLLENVADHLVRGWDRVVADLATSGYCVEWACLPAAAFGVPQRRWRLFAVAHRDRGGLEAGSEWHCSGSIGLGRVDDHRLAEAEHAAASAAARVGGMADGVPSRVDRLRCLGNAVVPQVAEWVGARIMQAMETAA
jgi:DNA (cytosine-5)-methyltransferase 1